MTQVLFNNVIVPYQPQRHNIEKFFRHGENLTNTVTLETGGEKGGLHFSVGELSSKGIMPNNSFNRKTMNLGFSYQVSALGYQPGLSAISYKNVGSLLFAEC